MSTRSGKIRDKARQVVEALSDYWDFYIRSTLTQQRKRYTVVQAVVMRDGQVLLVKRTDPRVWELPGGGIEEGETPSEAIIREVVEETGLQVRIERELGTYQRLGFRPHDSIVFVCTPIGGTLAHGDEAVDAQFFPTDRLPWGLLPWYREVIRDAVQPPESPRVRRQWLGLGTLLISLLIVLGERLRLLK
ncbi:MAG TPA: NUDIX domain-containing protein [Caldilineae bacterium]|jgi:ADP-ribose pyrophosphatase YjhB (NUDIX family)|nr:NUDIX domain-containing protein [Caldilineae bacterium]